MEDPASSHTLSVDAYALGSRRTATDVKLYIYSWHWQQSLLSSETLILESGKVIIRICARGYGGNRLFARPVAVVGLALAKLAWGALPN